jgi:enoyl-CoA hydratase/carnithine racemase
VKFTTAFARRGLSADPGVPWLLPRIVGTTNALDLLLSARVVLTEEAAELGLVSRVLPAEDLVEGAVAYAREVAINSSPASVATIKAMVYRQWFMDAQSALVDGERMFAHLRQGPEAKEGVAAFLERRTPNFPPLGHGSPLL